MTPHERRRLELEWQEQRIKIYEFEKDWANANAVFNRIRGRLNSINKAIDLGYAQRRRLQIMAQLGAARAMADTLARRLAPPRGQFDDIREREEAGLAAFAAMEKMVSVGNVHEAVP